MTDAVQWQHFEPATLARAAAEDKPVLMVLTAPWCQHSRALLSTSFADPQIVAAVADAFVPVHVDSERRPDVNQRFGTGAWPAIAWLTPDGELIAQDIFLDAAELHVRLERIHDAWRTVVTTTLDRMMESPLHDDVEGGFFRYSRTPDWHSPNYEKLLDQNALALRNDLEASYRRVAEGIVAWMLEVMRDPDTGAFAGSQDGEAN